MVKHTNTPADGVGVGDVLLMSSDEAHRASPAPCVMYEPTVEGGKAAPAPAPSAAAAASTDAEMVPFLQLFRFYSFHDRLMCVFGVVMCVIGGLAFPTVNVAFGELLDSTAAASNVQETTRGAVLFMVGVAVVLGVSLFLGFGFVGWAATRGADNVRREYLKAGASFRKRIRARTVCSYSLEDKELL